MDAPAFAPAVDPTMKSFSALLLLAISTAIPIAAAARGPIHQEESDVELAPDGKRGFGRDLVQKRLNELLRSKDEPDRAFFDELTRLATSTRVQLLNVRQLYVERGYFKLLPGSVGDDLAALHVAYAKSCEAPASQLAVGDARAKALAAMLVDVRFNVRHELMLRAEIAVDDLERARAVLAATQVGYVSFSPPELQHIAARADLAAAELRALRSDLEALTPTPSEKQGNAEDAARSRQLLEIARKSDAAVRESELLALLAPARENQTRMRGLLFSSRIDGKLAPLRQWRERVLIAAAGVRARVLELLPDTPEGEKARAEIARMKKTDRMSQAYGLAIEGLANDPLDPELAWAAGHARQFAWPGLDAVIYFDRFLALVGIRTTDPNPGNGRRFTPREQEASSAVTTFRR